MEGKCTCGKNNWEGDLDTDRGQVKLTCTNCKRIIKFSTPTPFLDLTLSGLENKKDR